jgi:filamentous hemagglutinin
VQAEVGGNLAIASLQDTSRYHSKDQNLGGSLTLGISNMGPVSGSISAGQSHIDSSYVSVTEQSGIQAGDGGFQVTVKGNTDLQGGVIASSAQAIQDGKNSLSTGTLTTSDIQNHADASASSSGINLSSDMLTQGKYGVVKGVIGNLLNNANESGSSSGHTRSAVSGGEVTITAEEGQQQLTGKTAGETVASLNRDTVNAQVTVQRLDVQAMQETVEAERAIKQEAFRQTTIITDAVYRSATGPKKILLEKCDAQGSNCNRIEVDMKNYQIEPGPDGKVYIFNHGILNTEAQALENAAKQSQPEANLQGVYVVINPHTGSALGEIVYAAWDKTPAPIFGISNAAEANIDLVNKAKEAGLAVEVIGHSRGGITIDNFLGQMRRDGEIQAPITSIQLNGSAGNAQSIQGTLDRITSGTGAVVQSTHQDDMVSRVIGANPVTGGVPGSFFDAHTNYGPNAEPDKANRVWGADQTSPSLPAIRSKP